MWLFIVPVAIHAQKTSDFLKVLKQDSFSLYFVKPVSLEGDDKKFTASIDFTFTCCTNDWTNDSILVHLSVFSKKPVTDLSVFLNEAPYEKEIMFVQQGKKYWETRLNTRISTGELEKWISNQEIIIQIEAEKQIITFQSDKEWRKASVAIQPTLSLFSKDQ